MDKLFTVKQVKRFFALLEAKERTCTSYYKGYDKLNPTYEPCAQDIFVRRTIAKWFGGKSYKHIAKVKTGYFKRDNDNLDGFMHAEEVMAEKIQYIFIVRISFSYGYGTKIDVSYIDAVNPHGKLSNFELTHNSALRLLGIEISEKEFSKVMKMFTAEKVECQDCSDEILHHEIDNGVKRCHPCREKAYMAQFEAKVEKRYQEKLKKKKHEIK